MQIVNFSFTVINPDGSTTFVTGTGNATVTTTSPAPPPYVPALNFSDARNSMYI